MIPKELFETLNSYETIILVGGGTGGHISPIVSVFESMQKHHFFWIGGKNSQEQETARKYAIPFESIPTLKLSTTRSPKILLYPLILLHGFFQARKIITNRVQKKGVQKNTCVFSKGGPGSVAIGLAAKSLGIPLYIHESDTIPGRSNMLLGKFSEKIFLGFEIAKSYFPQKKTTTIGQILDPALFIQDHAPSSLSWKTPKKHLLVFCGSLGARAIFESIQEHIEEILREYEVILVLGKLNTDMRKGFEEKSQYHRDLQIIDWLEKKDQKRIFDGTDRAITRGSATTLAELDMFHIKKIIIPLPHAARNHQHFNAQEYTQKGDILLEQKNLNALITVLHNAE